MLIVEGDLRMASLVRRGLVKEGLAADVVANGEDALWTPGRIHTTRSCST